MQLESEEIKDYVKKHIERVKKDLYWTDPQKKAAICALHYVNNLINAKERAEILKMYDYYVNQYMDKKPLKGGEKQCEYSSSPEK